MELRIPRARGAMPERRRKQPRPGHRLAPASAPSRDGGVALEVAEGGCHGAVMRTLHLGADAVVTDAEEHAHALRRREGHVEAGDTKRAAREQLAGHRRSGLQRSA